MKTAKRLIIALALVGAAAVLVSPVALEAYRGEPDMADEEVMAYLDLVSYGIVEAQGGVLESAGLVGAISATGGQSGVSPAPPAKPASWIVTYWRYVVKRGDSLSAIAKRYHTTVSALARVNRIRNVNRIYVGQRLLIPKLIRHGDNGDWENGERDD